MTTDDQDPTPTSTPTSNDPTDHASPASESPADGAAPPHEKTDRATELTDESESTASRFLPTLPRSTPTPYTPELPDPRPYIEIRPSTDPLDPGMVGESIRTLASALDSETDAGRLSRLRGTACHPAIEWVLVSDGREDAVVRWLVGVTLGDGSEPTAAQTAAVTAAQPTRRVLDATTDPGPGGEITDTAARERTARLDHLFRTLERALRRLLPSTYELTRVQWHPRYVEEHLPVPLVDGQDDWEAETDPAYGSRRDPAAVHPSITLDDPYVAGVQFRGGAEFSRDWLLPLTAFAPRPSRRVTRSFGSNATGRSGSGPGSAPSGWGSWAADRRTDRTGGAGYRSERERRSNSARDGTSWSTRSTTGPHNPYHPVADVVESLSNARLPTVYQVVCRPTEWEADRAEYSTDLRHCRVSPGDKLWNVLYTDSIDERDLPQSYTERIAGLDERETSGFVVAARLAVLTRDDPGLANTIANGFKHALQPLTEPVSKHRITGAVVTDDDIHARRTPPGRRLFDRIVSRTVPEPTYETRSWRALGRRAPSDGIVATAAELPGFCLVDGGRLTPHGQRSVAARPAERTGLVLPPPGQLAPYRGDGMELCMPLTHDRRPTGRPFALPEAFQDRHIVVAGETGSGKSVLINRMLRSNIDSRGGLHVLLDYKGTDSTREFLQTHYAARGDLDDVYYFDLTETLPGFTLFDIRPLLAAGVNREEARSRVAANYVEILKALMTPEKFDNALHAEEIITMHVRALFDSVHGRDVFSHRDLADALRATRDQAPPPVSNDALDAALAGLLAERQDIFQAKINGAISRVNVINTDDRLRPLFTYMPEQSADPEASPSFEFGFHDLLDADATVVFDFGGMDAAMKNGLTLAILSALWSALTCRAEASRAAPGSAGESAERGRGREPDRGTEYRPEDEGQDEDQDEDEDGYGQRRERAQGRDRRLVNLVLEEGGDVADTALVDTLLREGRSFGLSVTLGVQFPEQLRSAEPERNTYRELINEVGTFVVGSVRLDDDLIRALSTESMPPSQVGNRLRALSRGEWLVRPTAAFGADPPRPFLARSLDPPPGHPAGDDQLADTDRLLFDTAAVRARLESTRYGHSHVEPATGGVLPAHLDRDEVVDADGPTTGPAVSPAAGRSGSSDAAAAADTGTEPGDAGRPLPSTHVDSLLPHTRRLPAAVSYDDDKHILHCVACGTRYDSTFRGLCEGVECCHSLTDVDRDDIPPSLSHLKLSPAEVSRSRYSLEQLLFMQVVFNAQQGVYERLEYDLTRDSMNRLREYVGISREGVRELLDEGALREDTSYPHRLYSVAPQARSVIGEAYREGVDFGDGRGDLEESSEHVMLNELAARWARVTYVDDLDHPGAEVKKYHDLDDGHRLDCAVLDTEGDVCVAIETERVNHDTREAVAADYDKLARCDPLEAIWVVSGRSDAHAVLEALNDPLGGEPRVTQTYSESSPPQRWRIDEPGFSRLYTFRHLRRELDELETETDGH